MGALPGRPLQLGGRKHRCLPLLAPPALPAEERRRRMDFEIVQDELPETMRVMESPAAAAAAAAEEEDPYLP